MTKQKYILYFFTFFLTTLLVDSQYSVTGCNDNTFINSGDPNTIEYDDIISGFHASMSSDEPTGTEVIVSYFEEGEEGYGDCLSALCEEEIFFDDFGISDRTDSYAGRKTWPYMPSNSFKFGVPKQHSNIPDENEIDNNHYAVVAPGYIKEGSSQDYYFWTPPYTETGTVTDMSGAEEGAVMVVNAGNTLLPFYRRETGLESNTTYKISFWMYLVNGPSKVAVDIINKATGEVLGTKESVMMEDWNVSYKGKWVEHELYFSTPTITPECNLDELFISIRNAHAANFGNDYYIDDIKLSKLICDLPTTGVIEIKCPEPAQPVATPDINQTPEGKPVNGNVLTNDYGEEIKVTEITLIDENGNSKTVAVPTTGTVTEDVYVLDENGDPVKSGTITIGSDGNYTFTPENGYIGNVPMEYSLTNGSGEIDTTTLTIEVIPSPNSSGNNNPIAQDDAYTTTMGSPITSNILSNDSDVDGNTLTITGATQGGTPIAIGTPTQVSGVDSEGNSVPNAGTITINTDGTITFVPNYGFIGEIEPINYTISNGNGGTDEANIYLNVLPNAGTNATFANDDANVGKKGETLTGNVLGNDNDPEGNTQTLTSVTIDGTVYPIMPDTEIVIPGKGTLTMNPDGSYTFVPEEDFVGTVVVEATVCDDGTPVACDQSTLYLTTLGSMACYKPGNFTSTGLPTKVGITSLRNDNTDGWPQVRQGAWIALESKTKGFVPNRLSNTEIASITDPVEGMMVYNTDQDCLQIYVDTITGWKCFNVQSCD